MPGQEKQEPQPSFQEWQEEEQTKQQEKEEGDWQLKGQGQEGQGQGLVQQQAGKVEAQGQKAVHSRRKEEKTQESRKKTKQICVKNAHTWTVAIGGATPAGFEVEGATSVCWEGADCAEAGAALIFRAAGKNTSCLGNKTEISGRKMNSPRVVEEKKSPLSAEKKTSPGEKKAEDSVCVVFKWIALDWIGLF